MALMLMLVAVPLTVSADDMKESKNYWMNTHSNYMEFNVLVTDLWSKNTWAKDGYIRAYTNSKRQGTAITLLRVYTKDMGNDDETMWNVFARNMLKGAKAYMQNTVPMGDAKPDGSLELEERTFYVNKGSKADDTFVTIDYYYSPELAGKTWYFFYEYEHNSSGKQIMSLGSAYCSETADCSKFDTGDYTLARTNLTTIQMKLPAMPNDIEQKLQDVRKHVGHYDVTLSYTLFDGTTKMQTEAFDCTTQTSTKDITIPEDVRNFKTVDVTIDARDALEAEGGLCFWDDKRTWNLRDLFPPVPQPNELGADFLQFDNAVDLQWNSYSWTEASNYIESANRYVFRVETDAYGTPKAGQSWQRRDKLSAVGSTQHSNYTDKNVAADGKYYKYLILNVPKEWENKTGLSSNDLQSPSEQVINSLGHVESDVVLTAPSVKIYNLQQDIYVKDKVSLTWEYSRVPVASGSTVNFEVWRCLTGTDNWQTYANDIKGDASPKAGSYLTFTDADLPDNKTTYDYKVVLKLNDGKDQFESNVVTAGLLSGTTVTELTATKGTHDKVVRVAWKANQVGTKASNFELRRRYAGTNDEYQTIYNTSGLSDSYTYEDASVQPGRYYEYQVRAYAGEKEQYSDNNFQNMLTDVGFCQARGVITGRVSFGTSDNAVEDVRLTLRPSDDDSQGTATSFSQRVSGASTGIAWQADSTELKKLFGDDKEYTVQMFARPDEGLASGSVIGEIPGLGRLVLGDYADGGYSLLLEKNSPTTVEQTTFNTVNHLRCCYYYPYINSTTNEYNGHTFYSYQDFNNIKSKWEKEGFINKVTYNAFSWIGRNSYFAVFIKYEEQTVITNNTSYLNLQPRPACACQHILAIHFEKRKKRYDIGCQRQCIGTNDYTVKHSGDRAAKSPRQHADCKQLSLLLWGHIRPRPVH